MNKVFEILEGSPIISIVCTTIVLLAIIYILRNQIVAYIKKKYNLFSEEEVNATIREAVKEDRKKQGILKEFRKQQGK